MLLSRQLEQADVELRSELALYRQEEALEVLYASTLMRRAAVSERRATEVGAYELLAALSRNLPRDAVLAVVDTNGVRAHLEISGADPDRLAQGLSAASIIRHPRLEPALASRLTNVSFELVRNNP
jgi:hypothetical protein